MTEQEIQQKIEEYQQKCNADNKNTPLHFAAYSGKEEVVQKLLGKGADVNAVNKNGDTPLHVAACERHKEVVEILLNQRADFNAVNQYGNTPLHLAAYYGKEEVVQKLLKLGANVDAVNKNGDTALQVASPKLSKEIKARLTPTVAQQPNPAAQQQTPVVPNQGNDQQNKRRFSTKSVLLVMALSGVALCAITYAIKPDLVKPLFSKLSDIVSKYSSKAMEAAKGVAQI